MRKSSFNKYILYDQNYIGMNSNYEHNTRLTVGSGIGLGWIMIKRKKKIDQHQQFFAIDTSL